MSEILEPGGCMHSASTTDVRLAILGAARHLLVTEGYEQLSMRKIGKLVGCSAMAVYVHFENKDELFHTLIDEGMDLCYAALQQAIAGLDDPLERLERICQSYSEFALDNPEYYNIMCMVDSEHMARYPVEKYRRARRILDLFAGVLSEGSARGLLEIEGDPLLAASVLWSQLHGPVSLLITRRIDTSIEHAEFLRATTQRILKSLRHS